MGKRLKYKGESASLRALAGTCVDLHTINPLLALTIAAGASHRQPLLFINRPVPLAVR